VAHTVGTSTTYTPSRFYEATGSTTKKHLYVGDLLVATIENNDATTTTYTVHTDQLGGTNVVSDQQGNVVQVLDYYPYGALRTDEHTAFNERRKFIGQEYDDDSQLSYLNARYYAGARRQFISKDPMFWTLPRELLLDPQQQNSYGYGRDNPINNSDPSGLETIIVSGTFHSQKEWSPDGGAKDFIKAVGDTFNEAPKLLVAKI
jgi:RHS repeat-associated protein